MTPTPRLSTWSYGFIALYTVIGYFAGNEFSPLVGAVLTVLGLIMGWLVARKLTVAPISARLLGLGVPLGLMMLVLALHKPTIEVLQMNASALNGTWVSQGAAKPFTVHLNRDSALLSVESGLQNVAFHAAIQHDSLILNTEGATPLIWRIAKDTVQNALVLSAGNGIYFLKISPK